MDRAPPSWAPLEREYGWGGMRKEGEAEQSQPSLEGSKCLTHSCKVL